MFAVLLDIPTLKVLTWICIIVFVIVGIVSMSSIDSKFLRVSLALILLIFGIISYRYQSQLNTCQKAETTCYFMGNPVPQDGGIISL